ncbi:unnamed protein product [Moneuplotes crassus]|uniref:Uncharacterized protein n=1 Tax=Euplotes crassus TaxID=5936 RepID=A0AAD1U7Y6_EUPCR|nr:unnamed protein product [Moneuplotes crassus]
MKDFARSLSPNRQSKRSPWKYLQNNITTHTAEQMPMRNLLSEYRKQEDMMQYVFNCFTRGRPVKRDEYKTKLTLNDFKKPKRGKKKRRRRHRKNENDDQDENTNTSFSSANSENSTKKVRRCMTDPKILDDKYPYKKIFIKDKKSGKFTKKGSRESVNLV